MQLLTTVIIATCIVLVGSREVRAAPPTTAERINALVERARQHREAHEYDQAIAALREAIAIEPAPWLFYSLARAYEYAEKFELARSYYELCLGPNVDPETRTRAEDGMTRLAKRNERGRLQLRVIPTDATIALDGEPWAPDSSGVMQLTVGPHELMVSHSDYVPYQQRVEIAGGQTTTVVIRLNRKPVLDTTEPLPVKPSSDETRSVGPDLGAWPWVVLTAGVGTGIAGGILFANGTADWNAATNGTLTTDEATRRLDRGTANRNLGIGLMVGSGALIITSIVLFAIDGDDPTTAHLHFIPALTSDGVAMSLSGGF